MRWLRRLFRSGKLETQLDSELRFHIEQQTVDNIAAGMNADEARRRALAQFGGTEYIKEECRDARGTHFLETLLQDIRFALRMLRKSSGFTAVAVLTLALGIGANTAIFSIVDSLLLRPLPVAQPNQLVVLAFRHKNGPLQSQMSYPDIQDIQKQGSDVFSSVLAYEIGLDSLEFNGKGKRLLTGYVTGNFFTTLGLKPYLGRFILPSEGQVADADPVLVLSYSYWQ